MTDDPTLTPAQTAEHERKLLAAVLLDPDPQRCRDTLTATDPAWFADPDRAATWAQTRRVMATDPPPPAGPERVKAVHAEAADDPHGLSFAALADVTHAAPGDAAYYAARVRSAHLHRAARLGWEHDTERARLEALAADPDPAALIADRLDYFQRLRDRLPGAAAARRRAVPVAEIAEARPERLLHCAGRNGALLSIGSVLVLAGEGGIAKTPLALSVAAGMAARPDRSYGDLHGGLFAGIGGPALVVSYEDAAAVSADRLRKLAAAWWPTGDAPALRRVHVLNMNARPLFGPAPGDLYGARPGPLDGWADVWDEAKRIGARLVVIDPALSAYVGDANAAAPVRDFIGALTEAAEAARCGVLMVAHSRKDARTRPDPFDAGNVAGSTHWTDAARGALTLTWEADAEAGARVLAVSKANYGPARILAAVDPVRSPHGEIVGFAGGPWQSPAERKADAEAPAANGAGKVAAANGNPY